MPSGWPRTLNSACYVHSWRGGEELENVTPRLHQYQQNQGEQYVSDAGGRYALAYLRAKQGGGKGPANDRHQEDPLNLERQHLAYRSHEGTDEHNP